MNFIQNLRSRVGKTLNNLKTVYRTERVLRLYKKQKFEKIYKYLKSHDVYKSVKINDYHFIYFLLSEKNQNLLEKLMKLSYKNEILSDMNNPHFLSPIYFAAINNLYEEVELLKNNGANIFITGKDGNNLLHISCIYGKIDTFLFALKQGISVNSQNDNGDTPLHLTILKENFEIISILLDNGAKLDIKNNNSFYPIHEAVETGNLEIVKLLQPSLEKIRTLDLDFDPIHIAAKLENEEVLKYLIGENKLLANLSDNSSQNARPLHYACLGKAVNCAKFLLENGALINSQDKFGNTALHIAILNNDLPMCELLQKYKPNLQIKNQDKLSPLDLLYSENDKTIFKYFSSIPEYAVLFKIEN